MDILEQKNNFNMFNDYLEQFKYFIGEHIYELLIVIIIILIIGYRYSNENKPISTNVKNIFDKINEYVNKTFGKLWLYLNMQGKSLKTKSVSFEDEDEDEDYEDEYNKYEKDYDENIRNYTDI